MTRLEYCIEQLHESRRYLMLVLDHTDREQWYTMPPAGVSHIAWQIGHLVVADWSLLMLKVRGKRDDDAKLFPAEWPKLFGKGSEAQADASLYPSATDLLAALHGVREQALREIADLDDTTLDEPAQHPIIQTRRGAINWAHRHEMLHTGQIGLIRRQLGHVPYR